MSGDDRDRAQVYAAELAAFDGTSLEEVVPLAVLAAMADQLYSGSWWRREAVPLRPTRSDARSSSTRAHGARTEIRLAGAQTSPATLVHELAHVLAGVEAGHGPLFRRAHVDVSRVVLGDDASAWLLEAYAAYGLPVGARRWPAPPPGAIAL